MNLVFACFDVDGSTALDAERQIRPFGEGSAELNLGALSTVLTTLARSRPHAIVFLSLSRATINPERLSITTLGLVKVPHSSTEAGQSAESPDYGTEPIKQYRCRPQRVGVALPSIAPIVKSGLTNLGAFLATFNVAINILDLATTFLGFSRGMPEQNGAAALFMTIVGNEYLGAVIIKAAFIITCVIAYSAIRAVGRRGEERVLIILSLLLLDLVLAYLGSIVVTTVLGNFIALHWL